MLRFPASLVLAAIVAAGCGGDEARETTTADRPPIVIISIDTLRSDRLSVFGYSKGSTPAIDALARESILFERAFAEAPLTLPSHASIFTGRIPPRHGVRDNLGFKLEATGGSTLAERLRGAGYSTFGAVSSAALAASTGVSRGFERWDEPPAAAAERPGGEALAALRQELARAEPRPRLLLLHLYEPHAPYRPPEPFRSRIPDPYDGEIAAADALVGELVSELRARSLYDEAIVVLLSDHGEGLGDHGESEHGVLLYREALQVPLLVKLPKSARAGERISRNVALVDVVPTLIELLHLPAESGLDGLSLFSKTVAPDRPLYAETFYPTLHFGWSDLASVIAGDLHLVTDGGGRREELFDFVADPGERSDRREIARREGAAMKRALEAVDRTLAPPAEADAESLAKLGALGYLGGSALPGAGETLDDPRDRVRDLAPLLDGIRQLHSGELQAAVLALRRATAVEDAAPQAWLFLAQAYDGLGRKSDAADAAAEAAKAGGSLTLVEGATLRWLELGRADAAAELVRGEIARAAGTQKSVDPRSAARLEVLLSRAELRRERPGEAERAVDRALALDPAFADGYYQRAVIALAAQDGPAALVDFERAAALDARHLEARKALAMLLYSAGDLAGARARLDEVLAIAPGDPDARDGVELIERRQKG